MYREWLRSVAVGIGTAFVRTGRSVRQLVDALASVAVALAYLHPILGALFGLILFYVGFVRLRPLLSWVGLADQAIAAVAGTGALVGFWAYGLRILFDVDVFAPVSRRARRAWRRIGTDDPTRRDPTELASALESKLEGIAETERELDALGRPSPETLSLSASERRRRASRLLAALEADWDEVARLASAIERRRPATESEGTTDGRTDRPPAIRGYDAPTWLAEARTRRERIGYWLESIDAESETNETVLRLDVQSALLARENESYPLETESETGP